MRDSLCARRIVNCKGSGITRNSPTSNQDSGAASRTESFGARLRRERERRKIALSSISENTKISVGLFEALERDDFSRWPCGIFRRSFMRAYAGAIGLDGDDVVREFVERFPDPADTAAAAGTQQAPDPALRLTLAESGLAFARGHLLTVPRRRWAAVGADAAMIAGLASCVIAFVGLLWPLLTIVVLCYYWGSILALGNTPGVCLLAPSEKSSKSAAPGEGAESSDSPASSGHAMPSTLHHAG